MEGIFQVQENVLFKRHKIVLWHKLNSLLFTLVCEEDENRALALHTLPLLAKVCAVTVTVVLVCG
jgi:hypothetical protein